ncbi:type IV pilin protein [Herbaspirillum sp. ST 5-3]|uniref:type IV pilin protein n=1 Tax=Herbaspirillum sp. ST 5-3 TaxID=2567936 RepID=UPI002494EA9D|nr:type IV pilin protein [Herbaspirillum sp. ST 5-3]
MVLKSRGQQGACKPDRAGFTLIEIMVALVIIVILSLIAYPGYQEAVRKGRRAEARAALMQLLQQEERAYSQHNSYIKFSQESTEEEEKKFKWFSGETSKSSAYEIKAEPCKNDTIRNCVQLIAMPGTKNVDSSYKDIACGELSVTSTGLKAANSPDCWK